jgi:hypothetical protein
MDEPVLWPVVVEGGPVATLNEERLLWLDLLDGVHVVVLTEKYRRDSPSPYCQTLSLYCPGWQLRGSLPVSFTSHPQPLVSPGEVGHWRAMTVYFLPYVLPYTNSRPAWAGSA